MQSARWAVSNDPSSVPNFAAAWPIDSDEPRDLIYLNPPCGDEMSTEMNKRAKSDGWDAGDASQLLASASPGCLQRTWSAPPGPNVASSKPPSTLTKPTFRIQLPPFTAPKIGATVPEPSDLPTPDLLASCGLLSGRDGSCFDVREFSIQSIENRATVSEKSTPLVTPRDELSIPLWNIAEPTDETAENSTSSSSRVVAGADSDGSTARSLSENPENTTGDVHMPSQISRNGSANEQETGDLGDNAGGNVFWLDRTIGSARKLDAMSIFGKCYLY